MSEEPKTISIDVVKEMLKEQAKQNAEMLASVIQELKKPTLLEQKAIDAEIERIRLANEERKTNSQGILQQMRDKAATQAICSHKHRDGTSHGVFIMEKAPSPGYILCQKNQCKIRPGNRPKENADIGAIYDTALFNRLFQELPSNELFG
jgi:hypothetical protein